MSPALSEEVVLFPESLLTAAAHPDPYPYYAALLAYRPLYREHRLGLWVALGAREVAEVLSSEAVRVRPPAEPVPAAIAGAPAGEIFKNLVRMNDGPRHAQAKSAVGACLAALDAAQIAAIARREAAALARTLAIQQGQELDLFNFAVPVRVVAQMIGLPEEIAGRCAALIGDFVRCLSPLSGPDEIAQSNKAAESLLQLLRDAWQPNSGLATHAERLRDHGLGEREAILANLVGFMSQTYEATAGLIGNTLLALARHPYICRRIAGDDTLLQRVIEEVARHDPSVHNTRRFVAEDCVIAGKTMNAGRSDPGRARRRQPRPGALRAAACLRPGPRRPQQLHLRRGPARLRRPGDRHRHHGGRHPGADGARPRYRCTRRSGRVPEVRQQPHSIVRRRRMIAVIFEVWPHPDHRNDYFDLAAALKPQLEKIDGFISVERFESLTDKGKVLSLSFWRDEDAVARWRNVAEHRVAQAKGRGGIFSDYRLRIASVVRDYGLNERAEAPKDSRARHG